MTSSIICLIYIIFSVFLVHFAFLIFSIFIKVNMPQCVSYQYICPFLMSFINIRCLFIPTYTLSFVIIFCSDNLKHMSNASNAFSSASDYPGLSVVYCDKYFLLCNKIPLDVKIFLFPKMRFLLALTFVLCLPRYWNILKYIESLSFSILLFF